MILPLGFWEISLVFASAAITLNVVSELVASRFSKINVLVNKKRLRNAATAFSLLFILTVAVRVITIIFES